MIFINGLQKKSSKTPEKITAISTGPWAKLITWEAFSTINKHKQIFDNIPEHWFKNFKTFICCNSYNFKEALYRISPVIWRRLFSQMITSMQLYYFQIISPWTFSNNLSLNTFYIAQQSWSRRFLNVFRYYLPLENSVYLHLNEYISPWPKVFTIF